MLRVTYDYTDDLDEAERWLNELPDIIAIDFECASKYSDKEKLELAEQLKTETDWEKRRLLEQAIKSDGLFHHSLNVPYHLSIATSDINSYVIILKDDEIRAYVMNWLVNTDKLLIIHNCAYDLNIIKYYTGVYPKNYYDTLLAVKVLTNNTEKFKSPVGLKDLMKLVYGDWAIAKENFNIKNMYDVKAIKYNAIDAAAAYHLYKEIMSSLHETSD